MPFGELCSDMGGSPGLVIMGGDSIPKVVVQIPALNAGWTFFHIYLL